jgi:hypothetical protein
MMLIVSADERSLIEVLLDGLHCVTQRRTAVLGDQHVHRSVLTVAGGVMMVRLYS